MKRPHSARQIPGNNHDRSSLHACRLHACRLHAYRAGDRRSRAGAPRHGRGANGSTARNRASRAAPGHQEPNGPGVLSLLPGDAVTQHSIDLAERQTRLYGDRRDVLALRPIRSALRRGVLYGLRGEIGRSGAAAGDLRIQWRAGRRLGVPQPRTRRSAPRRLRQRAMTAQTSIWWTIRTPGLPSPIWC